MSKLYSSLKAAWHLDRIQDMRSGKQAAPIGLQLILSDLCNHDCHFCAYRAENGLSVEKFVVHENGKRNHNPNRMIPTSKAKEIIKDFALLGGKSVTFTGGGEPTVHPDHLHIFEYAMDLGLEASLNTNGAILRDGWKDVLPRMAYVRVSIDAGTPREYAHVRRVKGSVYLKVLNNLEAIATASMQAGDNCVVGTGYVVSPTSHKHLATGVTNIRNAGAKYVRLAAMQSTEGLKPYKGSLNRVRAACADVEKLATSRFAVVNLFDGVIGQRLTDPLCGFQQLVNYIGADLKLYRCCYTAYSSHGEIGDISKRPYRGWFHSPEKQSAIAEFDARSCDTCPLKEKNEIISYMVNEAPPHINFV